MGPSGPDRRRRVQRAALALFVTVVAVLGFASPAGAQKFPDFTAPVVDAAKVLPDDVEQQLNAELLDYQQRTGNQLAVAIVETTGDAALEDYTIDLARKWGVGEKGKDNGVLLLIAYEDRRLRIEVGRGLEGDLTDLESGRIIREQIVPRMRAGDVGGAVVAGTHSIRAALGDTEVTAPVPIASPPPEAESPFAAAGGFLLIMTILGLGLFTNFVRRRGRPDWMTPWIYTALITSGSHSRSGSGSSFGGFSGGGGGSFGGGGASGSW